MADVMSRTTQIPIRQHSNAFMSPPAASAPGFQANKETEWSRVCDNVLGDYLADDDVFGLGSWQHKRSSSDESTGGFYGYSMSSGQSNQTTGTSPDPTWLEQVAVTAAALDNPMGLPPSLLDECAVYETPSGSPTRIAANFQQPTSVKSNKPLGFWAKTVNKLEQGARLTIKRDQLRPSKSHPDFLSLGGHPSPATVPCPMPQVPIAPVPAQNISVPRSRGRESANGKKRSTSQLRSLSRGRPQGVAKSTATTGGAGGSINNGNASVRKASLSPSKMMNPSRYRAGFQEALAEKLSESPTKPVRLVQHHQSLPPPPPPPVHLQQHLQQRHQQQRSSFPASPPSSAQIGQHDIAAFGASPMHAHAAAIFNPYDTELSPLASTFQQARLHTPDASPYFGQTGPAVQSYFDHNVALASNYTTHAVSLNDAQPVYPERTTSLAPGRIGSFDFDFATSSAAETWPATSFEQPSMTTLHGVNPNGHEVFTGVHQATLQQLEHGSSMAGLGISCDTTGFYPQTAAPQDYTTIPDAIYSNLHMQPSFKACYAPMSQQSIPTTPSKQVMGSTSRNETPSPPMTDSRVRRSSGAAGLRRVSKHRRTKSATSVPRSTQNAERGGFVNFTPDDSGRILSGVAPSGSSKTKARREKEAADKRRRLSQAAIKAVLDAGGDAEDLVKAGFDV